MLHARLGLAAAESKGNIHVIIHAAHGVDHVLDHVHAEADVVINLDAQQIGDGVHRVAIAILLRSAAKGEGCVDLVELAALVDSHITIARDGDHIHILVVKVHRD